jgi:hypothetical protein
MQNSIPRLPRLAVVAAAVFATAAVYVSPVTAVAVGTCKPASNIEAIVDDSGSMSFTDPDVNRVAALKLLISKPGNAKKSLGALEFGSDQSYLVPPVPAAVTLFKPQPIAANEASMKSILDAQVKANNGATDYNAAFALAKADNPTADARIFITDGGHNEGDYANGHLGGPPTYVIGLGIGKPSAGPDAARLQAIAKDTGGVYYPNVTKSTIQAVVNQIDAALDCQSVAKTFSDNFTKQGQSKSKVVSVGAKAKSVDLTLTWESPLDTFSINGIKLRTASGATVSVAKRKLRIKRSAGRTYLNVHISGVSRGRLTFKLRSKVLASGSGSVRLITQAVPSRRG